MMEATQVRAGGRYRRNSARGRLVIVDSIAGSTVFVRLLDERGAEMPEARLVDMRLAQFAAMHEPSEPDTVPADLYLEFWNATEQVRATLASNARLAREAGHPQLGTMLDRAAGKLFDALEAATLSCVDLSAIAGITASTPEAAAPIASDEADSGDAGGIVSNNASDPDAFLPDAIEIMAAGSWSIETARAPWELLSHPFKETQRRQMRAAVEALAAAGYSIVPTEPTLEMRVAGRSAIGWPPPIGAAAPAAYSAMVAAGRVRPA